MQIHEHGSTRIGHICHMGPSFGPTRQPPDNPCLHCSKEHIPIPGRSPGIGVIVENPLDFRTRKIGSHGQTGFVTEPVLSPIFNKLPADLVRTCTLPYNGIIIGLSSILVPEHGGFPLVCYTDSREI